MSRPPSAAASRRARCQSSGATAAQFSTCGRTPAGWKNRRMRLRGGPPTRVHTSSPSIPARRSNAALVSPTFQARSIASAGKGSWLSSISRTAARTGAMSGASMGRVPKAGAKPAASSHALRSRSGTSSASVSCSTMARLGRARPDSRKLRCRCETPVSSASASCETRRCSRHSRRIAGKTGPSAETYGARGMVPPIVPAQRSRRNDPSGNCRAAPPGGRVEGGGTR